MEEKKSPLFDPEIFDMVDRAMQNFLHPERFTIIFDDDKVRTIFDLCQSAIDCDYETFREGIETANFEKWNIKRQNFIQELTYRLTGPMGSKWYDKICWRMYWEKTIVSGQGKKLENDPQINKLNRILARPGK